MYSATVVKNIPNNDGYSLKHFLNKEELNYYRNSIENQWFYRLQILDPKIDSFIYKNNINIQYINDLSIIIIIRIKMMVIVREMLVSHNDGSWWFW